MPDKAAVQQPMRKAAIRHTIVTAFPNTQQLMFHRTEYQLLTGSLADNEIVCSDFAEFGPRSQTDVLPMNTTYNANPSQ